MRGIKLKGQVEKYKIAVMAILLAASCFLTYLCHGVLKTDIVFTHFFYIPILLAAVWWKRKGLLVAIFLAVVLILSHTFLSPDVLIINDYFRALLFIVIAVVVAILSERITKSGEATKRAHSELHQIFNTAAGGMCVIDKGFNVLRVNEAFLTLSGISEDGAVGKKCYEVFQGPLCRTLDCPLTRILGGEERIECEIEKEGKDGTRIPCIVTATPFLGAGDKLIGIVEDFKDITERKRAEETLRESEEKYRGLVNNVKSGVFRSTPGPSGRFLEVNPAMEEITGYSREELLQMNVCDLYVRPEERVSVLKEIASTIGKTTRELHLRKKNGTEIVISDTKVVIRDDAGKILYFDGIIEDITERKRVEEEVRRLNEELELEVKQRTKELVKERDYTRHLIESSPDFQMTLDKDGRIMDVNKAFEEIVSKSRKDVIGTSIYQYLPKEPTEKAIAEIFNKKKVRDIEITAKIPGKGDLICNLSGTVFTTPEGELGIYATGREITEQRKQQETILAKERQIAHTSRLSTLGEMATAMAHEINQPLTVISMAAEGLLRDIKKDRIDISLLPEDIEDVLRNVQRIDKVITHMRTFARQPGEQRVVEPEQILDNAFIIVGEQFKVHGISVPRHIEESLPPIEVDPNQLEQVFINILTNARQVLDGKGGVAERAGNSFQKQLVCSIFREGDDVVFEFADNGYGVPDEIKSRIFEPFFTTKESERGTGLGLSIAYSIVTQSLNGRIWVKDNEMGGASFKVAVPIADRGQKVERGYRWGE